MHTITLEKGLATFLDSLAGKNRSVATIRTYQKQTPRNSRRNLLPMKCINGPLLMSHEHVACAVVELMQSRKTPSGTDCVLHHTPKAFNRVEVVPTMGR